MAEPDRQGFVASLYPLARRFAAATGIPADVLLAIAAHESNFGNAGDNMLFGIKGKGKTYATHEIVGGKRVDMPDSFRTYDSPAASFQDFIDLVSQGRYAQAWQHLQTTGDWRGFLRGINDAGYATDPNWADKIASFAKSTIAPLSAAVAPRTAEAAEADPTVRVIRGGQEVDPNTPGLETQQGGAPMAEPSSAGSPAVPKTLNTRHYWLVPGEADKKGQPIEHAEPPPSSRGGFFGVGTTPTNPVEYREDLYENGDLVTSHWDAQQGEWAVDDLRIDKARRAAWEQDTKPPKEQRPSVIGGNSPNEQFVVTRQPDGTLDAQPNPNYVPPKPAAAERPRVVGGTGAANEQFIVQQLPDGSTTTVPNPNYVAPRPQTVGTSANEPWIVQQLPDGTTRQLPNPNYQPPRPTTHVGNNRAVTVDADGNIVGNTVLDPEAQGLANDATRASTANTQATTARTTALTPLDVQKAQRELLGPQLLAIQNHYQAVADVQRQLADPASALWADAKAQNTSPDALANRYIAQSKAYADAALQGATPFDLQKQAEATATAARQQGANILNQRLVTGSSLANALLSGATSLAQRALPMPGAGPIHVDPLAYARSFLDAPDVGGGADVSEFARKLLMASRPLPAGL